ncbi:glycoside hydrolase family 5 protein [Algisphaera agarilytica]|uniref:Endoglucanase n=1 Tax=Algisphaera agarilytica TaxID=1385975 RepID=A0A7X0H9Y6_9BACT|nr:glycoside hydrolase family 5 protein [Algisphaera agarilytica]MBB6430494.1 endoglucanase [Algisphaera agarilytica]
MAGLLALSATSQELLATPVERHGQLRVQGTQILDQHDQPVQLRGMSLFWSQWGGAFFNPDVVDTLVDDWGVTLIRVPLAVHRGGYMEHPEREKAKVMTVVDAAIARGVYVIVDWHAHEPEPEAAAAFFADLAQTHGHHPHLIYETWNEPLNTHGWAKVVKPYHERVVAAIREHDPDNLIVLGTPTWSQDVDVAAADPVAGTNLAYTLHFYAGSHGQALIDKARRAMEQGAALFVSEWGTSMANGGDGVFLDESRTWLDFLDEHQLSWANWSLFDKDESSCALRPGSSPRGPWPEDRLTASGRFVREQLQK